MDCEIFVWGKKNYFLVFYLPLPPHTHKPECQFLLEQHLGPVQVRGGKFHPLQLHSPSEKRLASCMPRLVTSLLEDFLDPPRTDFLLLFPQKPLGGIWGDLRASFTKDRLSSWCRKGLPSFPVTTRCRWRTCGCSSSLPPGSWEMFQPAWRYRRALALAILAIYFTIRTKNEKKNIWTNTHFKPEKMHIIQAITFSNSSESLYRLWNFRKLRMMGT